MAQASRSPAPANPSKLVASLILYSVLCETFGEMQGQALQSNSRSDVLQYSAYVAESLHVTPPLFSSLSTNSTGHKPRIDDDIIKYVSKYMRIPKSHIRIAVLRVSKPLNNNSVRLPGTNFLHFGDSWKQAQVWN